MARNIIALLVACAAVAVGSLSARAQSLVLRNFAYPSETTLTISGLETLAQSRGISRIDDLLPALPPEMLRSYALVYASRSLQDASPLYPRVISYTNDARLIIAFNGRASQRGYQALELIEFVPGSPGSGASRDGAVKPHFEFARYDFSQNPPVLERNPPECMTCHKASLRPNWDGYFVWPGVYGSEDDHLTNRSHGANPARYAGTTEAVQLQSFLDLRRSQIASGTGRYRFLRDRSENPQSGADFPNLRLTILLSELNSQRMLAEIQDSPRATQARHALRAAYCDNLLEFFSPAWRAEHAPALARMEREGLAGQLAEAQERAQRHHQLVGPNVNPRTTEFEQQTDFSPAEARLRFIAEEYLGVPTSEWSMTLGRNPDSFGTGDNGIHFFILQHASRLFTSPADQAFLAGLAGKTLSSQCEMLLTESIAVNGLLE